MVNIITNSWNTSYHWFMKYMYSLMYVWYVDNELELNDNIIYCRLPDTPSEPDLETVEPADPKFIPLEDVCTSITYFQIFYKCFQ